MVIHLHHPTTQEAEAEDIHGLKVSRGVREIPLQTTTKNKQKRWEHKGYKYKEEIKKKERKPRK